MNDILYYMTRVILVIFLLLTLYVIRTPENDASDEWDNW